MDARIDSTAALSGDGSLLQEAGVFETSDDRGESDAHPIAAHGTIVPLYASPGDPSWAQFAAGKKAHPLIPIIAVVNNDGGPGAAANAAYASGIAALQNAGVVVIGYVYTSQGTRALGATEADVDSWSSFYSSIDGIFLDERTSDDTTFSYYQPVSQYAKSKGLAFNVENIAWHVPADFVPFFDAIICWENGMLPRMSYLDQEAMHESITAIIPYNVSYDAAFVLRAKKNAKYIYLTSDPANPSPWTIIPSYFDQLLTDLEAP